jgi:cell division protein FtsB
MKWFAFVLVVVTVLLQYRLWLSDDGIREVSRLSAAVEQQQAANAELARRNGQLAAEVADLKSGMAALEERARSELGMVARNESFFQVVPRAVTVPAPPADPRTRTAQR